MTNRAKASYVNALRAASGIIDRITVEYYDGSYGIMTPQAITWDAATDANGKLVLNTVIDFTNNTGGPITIQKVSILNSANTSPTYLDSVSSFTLPSPAEVEAGQTFRVQTADYTVN